MFGKKKTILIKKSALLNDEAIEKEEKRLSDKTGCNVVIINAWDEVVVVG